MSFGISSGSQSSTASTDQLVQQFFQQMTQNSSTSNGSQSTTGSSTTAGTNDGKTSQTLSPEQQATQPMLFKTIQQLMTDPDSFYKDQQDQARNNDNDNFAGVDDALRSQFLTGGGGEGSGKYGKAVLSSDLARRSKLSDTDTSFAIQKANAPITAAQMAQAFLGLNFGQENKGTTGATTTNGATTATTDTTNGTVGTTGSTNQSTTGTTATKGKQFGVTAGASLI